MVLCQQKIPLQFSRRKANRLRAYIKNYDHFLASSSLLASYLRKLIDSILSEIISSLYPSFQHASDISSDKSVYVLLLFFFAFFSKKSVRDKKLFTNNDNLIKNPFR